MKLLKIILFTVLASLSMLLWASDQLANEQVNVTVNVNKANAVELAAALKGVGQLKAEAIVAYREQYGEFKSAEELSDVKGIGAGIISKNQHVIVVH